MSSQIICDWCQNKFGLESIYIGSINQGSLDSDNQAVANPTVPTLTRHFHPYCWSLFYAAATAASPPAGGPVPQPPSVAVVTAISPSTGPTAGGTSVTITGSGFTNVTAVHFGNTPAASFTVNSDLQITASAPPGSAGQVDITVANPVGESVVGANDKFTYTTPLPSVTSVSPNSDHPAGGAATTITGTGFTGATAVKFGTVNAATFSVVSDTQITATVPAGTSSSTVDVTVTTPNGTSLASAADHFSYLVTMKEEQPKSGNGSKRGKKS